MSTSSRAAARPGSPKAEMIAASAPAPCSASASRTACDAIDASTRFSMYSAPNRAVATAMSVPGDAERRASSAMIAVMSSEMFGLMSSSFMSARLGAYSRRHGTSRTRWGWHWCLGYSKKPERRLGCSARSELRAHLLDGLVEDRDHAVDLGPCDHEWRGQGDGGATAARAPDDHAISPCEVDHALDAVRRHDLLALAV